ncbi:MAG: DUF6677 family protein [Candidatus Micrarchaeota archaeon]
MGDMVVSMILSFLFPGIGQAYLTKQWVKGVIFFIATCVLSFVLIGVIVWLYGLYDTYKIAKANEGGEAYKSPIFG